MCFVALSPYNNTPFHSSHLSLIPFFSLHPPPLPLSIPFSSPSSSPLYPLSLFSYPFLSPLFYFPPKFSAFSPFSPLSLSFVVASILFFRRRSVFFRRDEPVAKPLSLLWCEVHSISQPTWRVLTLAEAADAAVQSGLLLMVRVMPVLMLLLMVVVVMLMVLTVAMVVVMALSFLPLHSVPVSSLPLFFSFKVVSFVDDDGSIDWRMDWLKCFFFFMGEGCLLCYYYFPLFFIHAT